MSVPSLERGPGPRSVSNIKSLLLRPATTSHFMVEIGVPASQNFRNIFLPGNGIDWNSFNQDRLQLMCSEATLPGSSLATLEATSDFHGVTERHAYRRVYDDRIDLTFYVDAENYYPIRFFETWIKYIVDESRERQPDKGRGSEDASYFYRVRYPDGDGRTNSNDNGYVSTGLKVIKFEKDYSQRLEYKFIKAYPISISSMPVSYESSSLLKCTVSMTYIRYVVVQGRAQPETNDGVTPEQQASFNGAQNNLSGDGGLSTQSPLLVGGVSPQAANAAGAPIDRRVEAGLPYVGRNVGPGQLFAGI